MNKRTIVSVLTIIVCFIVVAIYSSFARRNDEVPTTSKGMAVPTWEIGNYQAYSPEKIARASTMPVILFFHAPWCPTCRTADADIRANIAKSSYAALILRVDFESETALRKKYGVTYQHTFVHVDMDGNLIKKWSGSDSLDAIYSHVRE